MNVREFLQNNIVVLDGGTGTLLQAAGLPLGELPERWNITHADVVADIHRAYFDAGSNVVCTNTFGANALKFDGAELEKIVASAVANARKGAELSKGKQPKFVALDIGPSGKLLKPYGDFAFEEAVALFAKTVKLGVKYGVDLVFIETMGDSYETKAALLAVKENSELPVFVSNAYGGDGKLMTGATPAAMVAMLESMGADAIGANCSLGPKQLAPVAEELLAKASVPVLIKPNAGLPQTDGARTYYDVDEKEFAAELVALVKKGVRVIGGCCGTTPAYIGETAKVLAGVSPLPLTEKNIACVSSYTHAVEFDKPLLIGERINPTGKKRFKQALLDGETDYALNEALSQRDKGAQLLDVNVGLPGIDERKTLTEYIEKIQAVVDLPLQIDTSDPVALESALRAYNGKPLVNSVNGKRESMDAVFPLVKKYGGAVVALTLDENGIPETWEGRVAIAEKIVNEAARYGIKKKDVFVDTLTMSVATDKNAARTTLSALRFVSREMGLHSVLGVSNVSFGLPARETVNASFFALALENGLSAAILNPASVEMQKTYRAFLALNGTDENCGEYIRFATEILPAATPATVSAAPPAPSGTEGGSPLQTAISEGLKDRATALCKELLQEVSPLEIVNGEIVPALDTVGKAYEEKRAYLPRLLMSAEAAKCAFEVIKNHMLSTGETQTKKCKFVIATVKGDIHDIGKNIVRTLLENYGFDVVDLGRDVPPETVLEAVRTHGAPLVGLSALMTTTVPSMEETIGLLKAHAPACKIVVGGAVLNREYAEKIGADAYAKDGMETVRYAEKIYADLCKNK
ncbi:MAG: homocysteine S-methyltransferase family protein [Clostridia bacterium]|nr:homocysteine S-methyltransferase family protein [Clostridia bacterium]